MGHSFSVAWWRGRLCEGTALAAGWGVVGRWWQRLSFVMVAVVAPSPAFAQLLHSCLMGADTGFKHGMQLLVHLH